MTTPQAIKSPTPPYKIELTSGEVLYKKLSSNVMVKKSGGIVSMMKIHTHSIVDLRFDIDNGTK
jgi:hypothetical protein